MISRVVLFLLLLSNSAFADVSTYSRGGDVEDGNMQVVLQDQTTRPFDIRLSQNVSGPYSLASDVSPNSYTITLTSATGLTVGDEIGLFQDTINPQSYFGTILSIATNTLTMDTPIDGSFTTSLSPVLFELNSNLNVDGSTTPQVFILSNGASIGVDIVRILLHITDDAAMDDGKFGGITALTRGVVLRKLKADGSYINLWHRALKTNGEFGLVGYDKEYDDKAPAGIYGLRLRYTLGGQSKHGVVIRLDTDEQLQLVVQDDLTDLTSFEVMAEGHYTID